MSPALRRTLWLVLLVGLAAGLGFVLRSQPTVATVTTTKQAAPGRAATTPPTSPSTPVTLELVDAGPSAPPIRRQVELAYAPPTVTSDAGLRAVRGLGPPKPPTDKRAAPGARAQQELEILGYAFEALEEDVRECLSQWEALDAGATGEVMLVFQLDSKGLQKTWLDSAADVPFGPRSCISNAVYGLDWANVVSEPAQVSQRFELSAPDGG
ncbi:MAG: hypothetical protein Q8S33_01320 [Myxococcales bacterium]|nr:hypothetical protein [Myxococcales bacterium]